MIHSQPVDRFDVEPPRAFVRRAGDQPAVQLDQRIVGHRDHAGCIHAIVFVQPTQFVSRNPIRPGKHMKLAQVDIARGRVFGQRTVSRSTQIFVLEDQVARQLVIDDLFASAVDELSFDEQHFERMTVETENNAIHRQGMIRLRRHGFVFNDRRRGQSVIYTLSIQK